jgi:hypothetical protein
MRRAAIEKERTLMMSATNAMDTEAQKKPEPVIERSWLEANLKLVKAVNKDNIRDRRFWMGIWWLQGL